MHTRLFTRLHSLVALATGLTVSLVAQCATAQDFDHAALRAAITSLGYTPVPCPPFPDNIEPDSPNIAARLIWHFERIPARLRLTAEYVDDERWDQFAMSEFAGEEPGVPDAVAAKALMASSQTWIDGIIDSSRLQVFELRWPDDLTQDFMPNNDPRRDFHTRFRGLKAILIADALRLFVDGESLLAAHRLAALVHLARLYNAEMTSDLAAIGARAMISSAIESATMMLDAGAQKEDLAPVLGALLLLNADDHGNVRQTWLATTGHAVDIYVRGMEGDEISPELYAMIARMKLLWNPLDSEAARLVTAGVLPPRNPDGSMLEGLTGKPEEERRSVLNQLLFGDRDFDPGEHRALLAEVIALRTEIADQCNDSNTNEYRKRIMDLAARDRIGVSLAALSAGPAVLAIIDRDRPDIRRLIDRLR